MAITATKITASLITANPITATQISAGGGGAVCRWFSNFNGVDSYADISPAIELTNDFEISFTLSNIATVVGQNAMIILGSSIDSNPIIAFIDAGGSPSLRVRSSSGSDFSSIVPSENGDYIIRRTSGVVEIFHDGISIGSGAVSGDFNFDKIGDYLNSNFWLDGIMYDLLVTNDGVLDYWFKMCEPDNDGVVNYINSVTNGVGAIGYNINTFLRKETHVFVLGGQSNMVGRADYDGLGDYNSNIYQLNQSGQVVQAVSPLDHLDENAGDMGLTITFCDEYAAANPDVDILLVPCADGGTSFQSGQWGVGNPLYDAMKSRTALAMATSPNTILKGLLWHQGESDAGNASYESQLDAQMNDYKAFCSTYIADIPIVMGQMFQGWVGTNPDRVAIQNIINDSPSRLTRTLTTLSDGLTSFDNLHFDSSSLRVFGERYYEQYDNIITNAYEFIDGELYIDGEPWID